MQDYQQNRKTAGSTAFNQSAFGGTAQPQPSTSTTLFGQSTQQQPANSMFGSFGNAGASGATSGSAFGGVGQTSTQPTGGFGAFNQAQPQPQPPAQQPAASGFGSFNQAQQPQPQNTGLFGGGSAFAAPNKPLGGFGMSYQQSPYR
jgi:nucleoporin p58/p45